MFGGHSELVPRLPIPNRTVKRLSADDSTDTRVKVGHRQTPLLQPPEYQGAFTCADVTDSKGLIVLLWGRAQTTGQAGCRQAIMPESLISLNLSGSPNAVKEMPTRHLANLTHWDKILPIIYDVIPIGRLMNTQDTQYLQDMLDTAVAALEDVKAKDIVIIDTSGKTSLFARMIVAGGDSTRQVKALANHVAVALKEKATNSWVPKVKRPESGHWWMPGTWWSM